MVNVLGKLRPKQWEGGKLSIEEQATFGAIVRQAGTLMVAPALLDYVKGEVEKDVALQKGMRKAREERES